ncbi:MAG: pirin family protein [Thermoplasmatota archaeon]
MIKIRRSTERGHANHGWLDTYHTFSFADYFDPEWMRFRALRVLNEDRVDGGTGFDAHPHRDMEILTIPLAGALAHRDSTGGEGVLRAGEVQRMTAGTGVVHSEKNASATEPVRFLQIWLHPERVGLPPSYEQRAFPLDERRGRWRLLAARHPKDALTIHQDVSVYATVLAPGEGVEHTLAPGRSAWLHVIEGSATVNGETLAGGDAAAFTDESRIAVRAASDRVGGTLPTGAVPETSVRGGPHARDAGVRTRRNPNAHALLFDLA